VGHLVAGPNSGPPAAQNQSILAQKSCRLASFVPHHHPLYQPSLYETIEFRIFVFFCAAAAIVVVVVVVIAKAKPANPKREQRIMSALWQTKNLKSFGTQCDDMIFLEPFARFWSVCLFPEYDIRHYLARIQENISTT
jgi:hypothetical protein